jgi:hypothetical protein
LQKLQQAVRKAIVLTPNLTQADFQSLPMQSRLLLLVREMFHSSIRMCQTNVTTYNIMDSEQ